VGQDCILRAVFNRRRRPVYKRSRRVTNPPQVANLPTVLAGGMCLKEIGMNRSISIYSLLALAILPAAVVVGGGRASAQSAVSAIATSISP